MGRLSVFDQVTLDGYFAGPDGDIGWAHGDADDAEWNDFVSGNASGEGALVFGRITYQMMAGFWRTPEARKAMPVVAEGMNRMPKFVFSRTLDHVDWSNTTVLKELVPGMRKLKNESGPDLVILGSGSIVAQLAEEGLIDEYQIVISPVALGKGRTLFDGIRTPVDLKLTQSRTFRNGRIVSWYIPA